MISGEVFGVKGPIVARTPAYYVDFEMQKGQSYEHVIPVGWNSMVVVHNGKIKVQNEKAEYGIGHAVVFRGSANNDEIIKFEALEDNTKFIMLAGKPIKEPIVAYGPFVLSSEDEMEQTFDDYNN